ncbi:hypothetical protein HZA40_03485 [Candidatus Peregrinibacteria bacterium]|nr:hypothetical protein [Candidatus Peregrinibacteria bacterium]
MDIEKKRMIFFGSILAIAIIGSLVLFFWGNVLNRGTLKITGDAPFSVEIVGLGKEECPASPCSIKTKSGYHELLISKSGYQTILTSSTVKLWRTTALPIQFQIIPQVTETDTIPDPDKKNEYELVMDSKSGMQKLIRKDQISTTLAYFPKPTTKADIIGGKNTVLIIDSEASTAYIVDLQAKSRTSIDPSDLADMENGSWSDDGKYLIFSKKNSPFLWLLDVSTQKISSLTLATNLKQTSWAYNDDLIFITEQSYSSINDLQINLLDEKSTNGLTFGLYKPLTGSYQRFGDFPTVLSLPDEFIATANGDTVYFKSGKRNFRIILRKF